MSVLKNEEVLRKIILENNSYISVLERFGFGGKSANYRTLKKYIKLYNIDITHFQSHKERMIGKKLNQKFIFEDIFCNPTKSKSGSKYLKDKILSLGIKEDKCEECGVGNIWNNKPINLQLDHIDGNNINNELNNLKLLCPNCHSQTSTYAGRNRTKCLPKIKENIKLFEKEIKLGKIKQQIINSNIDFSKKTWGTEVSKVLNKTPQWSLKLVKTKFPELLTPL